MEPSAPARGNVPVRILLLNPPGRRTYFRDGYCSSSSKSGYRWQPLDLLVQAGILTAEGHEVALVDAIGAGMGPEATRARVAAFAPDAVVALAADVSWPEDVGFLRRLAADGARLVLSGDVPRFEPERAFEALPTLECILHDFVSDALSTFLETGEVGPGLRARDGRAGPTIRAGGRVRSWPSARHDLLPRDAYRLPFHGGAPFASVLASYGCPFACTFCNTGRLDYLLRPVGDLIAELRLVRGMGFRRVYLRDATANGHREHWLEACRAIARADLGLRWNVFCTLRPFDAAIAQAMAAAGCTVVQFGFETQSAALRAETGKPFDNEHAHAAVRYAHEAGLRVCGHFVLGLPGQDAAEVRRTAAFARALDLDWASFNLAAARPGTGLRDAALSAGLAGGDASGDGFEPGLADVPGPMLRRMRRDAVLRFYLRPRPLRALLPDLRGRDGWTHLRDLCRAAVQAV